VPIPIALVDAQWRVLAVNPAFVAQFDVGPGWDSRREGLAGLVGCGEGTFARFPLQGPSSLDPDEPFAIRGVSLSAATRGGSAVDGAPGAKTFDVLVERPSASTAAALATHLKLPSPPAAVVAILDQTARSEAQAEAARLRAALVETERTSQRLKSLQAESAAAPEMVGLSAPLRRVREQVARVGATDTTVLIHGETGSGKELVARAIHASSGRRAQAFVAVNCAALPESLIESELFGHEKGAFTGADRRRLGKFELADGGTLFLDEMAELPLAAQAKLLRVIQESAFERVGGAETVEVNVRIVAATHRDLTRQVERGRFREDLFYRLNVFRIEVPPLRERKEDLKALAEHLHAQIAARMGRPALKVSDASLRRIMAYSWPGNVRELANAVERATLLADGPELEIELPESPLTDAAAEKGGGGTAGGGSGGGRPAAATRDILLDLSLEQLQRLQITHALETCGYKVFGEDGAAAKLDLNPSTLLSKMDKYGIPRPRLMKRARK
jgi:transcriptional regulator with GAF, ATPase, and Fis domain